MQSHFAMVFFLQQQYATSMLRLLTVLQIFSVSATARTVAFIGQDNANHYQVEVDGGPAESDPEIQLQVGEEVTFSKTFSGHSLRISSVSDSNNYLFSGMPWGNVNSGDPPYSGTTTFSAPGTYTYVCTIHGSMTGSITVSAAPPPPPPTPVEDVTCIDATIGVPLATGRMVPLGELRKGDELLTASGGVTTVHDIVTQHSDDPAYVVAKGVCGATSDTVVSPAHAIRCSGKWTTAKEVGVRLDTNRLVTYVNVQTDDYCSDELKLETGLVVETWDGRARNDWRPHSYENGERVGCKRA